MRLKAANEKNKNKMGDHCAKFCKEFFFSNISTKAEKKSIHAYNMLRWEIKTFNIHFSE